MGLILVIILVLLLVGALPTWGHSRSWGHGPSGGPGSDTGYCVGALLDGPHLTPIRRNPGDLHLH